MPSDTPTIHTQYAQSGTSTHNDALGMREMQARAYAKRGEQYLLIKSPPASGKSRALMFIAIDKVRCQGLKQALVIVPERSIGASFHDVALSKFGFYADWRVEPQWNLCDSPGTEGGKVKSVKAFLDSEDEFLICTHATFRFAFEALGAAAFDDRLLAVDEFHHVSADEDNILGRQLGELLQRDSIHLVAMTGSYFRGDAVPVLTPDDESRFETVTYTYYEQLNGYTYLKSLDIGYYFYTGSYVDDLMAVLDPKEKTIIHIPSVNSRESTRDKYREVEQIIDGLGEYKGPDEATGFYRVQRPDGHILRIADLVDDESAKRSKVAAALADSTHAKNRDHVDIIIALGMAKEGFDWIWCEHALTVGYRSSLTEIVQIIGRTTRDAPGKTHARFTNLIAEPDAEEQSVNEAVNDTLKAIAASLLMEQVLAPKFEFKAKVAHAQPDPAFDYGPGGYQPDRCNVGVHRDTGEIQVEVKGLVKPTSKEAKRICKEDMTELISSFVQDTETAEHAIFDPHIIPQETNQVRMGKIVATKYPDLDEENHEAVRQHAVATMIMTQQAKSSLNEAPEAITQSESAASVEMRKKANTQLVDGVRKYVMDVRDLDIDLIDSINPFGEARAILAKSMDETRLRHIESVISRKKTRISPDEALALAQRAVQFIDDRGRDPSDASGDAWERRLAEGARAYRRYLEGGQYD